MSDRFWKKVIKHESGCWEWNGARNSSGYGWVAWHGTQTGAHRVSWELTNGAIPESSHVLHKCDNRLCVRPDHLYLGTHTDNMRDRADRRRCGIQKLSKDDVISIRHLRSIGWTCQKIADQFGISNGHASAVARGLYYGRE